MNKNCPWKDTVGMGMRTDSNRKFQFILDYILNQTENNKNLNQGLPVPQYTFSPNGREYQLLHKCMVRLVLKSYNKIKIFIQLKK